MKFSWKKILSRWKSGYGLFWDSFLSGPSWKPPPESLISNRFHYRSSSLMLLVWCRGILMRIFTLPGGFLFAVMLISGFYSSSIFNTPAVLLFFVLLSVFLIDFTAGLIFFAKLSGTRSMPERVRSGEAFTVRYCIRNRRKRMPVFDLRIDPFADFGQGGGTEEAPMAGIIPGGGEISLERKAVISRRGVHKIGAFLAETSYPFHLLKISRNLDPRSSILICHPRALALDPEEIRTSSGELLQPAGGTSAFPKTGESMNFHGCRKFRYGDARRKICWRASARHGTLVVKEFQEEMRNRFSLVLDTHLPSVSPPGGRRPRGKGANAAEKKSVGFFGRCREILSFPPLDPPIRSLRSAVTGNGECRVAAAAFETALSLAASIAEELVLRNGFLLDTFAAGSRLEKAGENRNCDNLTLLIDLLASVQPENKDPFLLFDNDALDAVAASGSVFLILLRDDEKAWELYERLLMRGAEVRVFLISENRETAQLSRYSGLKIISPQNGQSSASVSPVSGERRNPSA